MLRFFYAQAAGLLIVAALLLSSPLLVFAADLGLNPNAANIAEVTQILSGGCESSPFPYLEQRHAGDRSNSFVTPRQDGGGGLRNGLNPSLACRLKKFMEFAETRGCRLTINSAMRPVQRCNPGGGACAPQGQSCHQYGLAVDVGGNPSCLAWVLQILGRKNPNSPFGIHSAYAEHPGYRHLQCIENLQAACSPQTKGCDGKVNINPDTSGIPNPGPAPSPLSEAIRQALGQQPPPPPPPPPPPQQQPPQALPKSSQPSIFQPVSNLITTATTPTSGLINIASTSPNVSPTSTYDLIDEYANPVSDSIDVGTIVTIALNDGTLSSTTQLQGTHPRTASGTIALNQGYAPQQTFTSGDLSHNPISGMAPAQNGAIARILTAFRNALLFALNSLKPFGGNMPR